ncbi:hypothetical protein QJQ45_005097 [Haematococcus lacustris]|nr:hypothetical protein QJQ45_005097 [Haematococcus lacustris]
MAAAAGPSGGMQPKRKLGALELQTKLRDSIYSKRFSFQVYEFQGQSVCKAVCGDCDQSYSCVNMSTTNEHKCKPKRQRAYTTPDGPAAAADAELLALMGDEVDHELDAQPEPSQAQQNMQASGEARWARHNNNTWHVKKCKLHTLLTGVSAVGLEAGAVVASAVVEARLDTPTEAWVKARSMRALLGSVLLGLMVRSWFTREVFEDIPAEAAVIPYLADRNLFLQVLPRSASCRRDVTC